MPVLPYSSDDFIRCPLISAVRGGGREGGGQPASPAPVLPHARSLPPGFLRDIDGPDDRPSFCFTNNSHVGKFLK